MEFTECRYPYSYLSAETKAIVTVEPAICESPDAPPPALSDGDILEAVRRLLNGELAKHGVSEATKAIAKVKKAAKVADNGARTDWAEMRLDGHVETDKSRAAYIAMLGGDFVEDPREEADRLSIEISTESVSKRYVVWPREQVLDAVMRVLSIAASEPFSIEFGDEPVRSGTFEGLGINDGGWLSVVVGHGRSHGGLPQGYDHKSAGLVFSVVEAGTMLAGAGDEKRPVEPLAAVAAAAVVEYVCAEILELGGNASRDDRSGWINQRHVNLAISSDEEFMSVDGR